MPLDVIQGSTPPGSPKPGDQWLNTANGRYYTWLIGPSGDGAWVVPSLGDQWLNPHNGRYYTWLIGLTGKGAWVTSSVRAVAGRAPDAAPVDAPAPMLAPPITNPTPKITSADIPPSTPAINDLWFDTGTGFLFIWYYDGDTYQWVVTNPGRGSDVPPPATVVPTTIESDPGIVLTPDPLLGIGSIGVDTTWLDARIASEIPANLPPSGTAGGALSGTYPNPSLAVPYPTTLPPNGPAGGALSGTYPNPGLAVPYPTTLPPNGPAGGDLKNTYPNPLIKPSVTNGQLMTTVGGVAVWAAPPSTAPSGAAGGDLSGTYPNPTINPEAIDDRVAALLVAGTNITLAYNDPANTLTINSTASGGGSATLPAGSVGYGAVGNTLTGVLADFSWDSTNKRLGVGIGAPAAAVDVVVQANSQAIKMSGYSLTGSNATGCFSIAAALNTTGTPDIFAINVTDTSNSGGNAFIIRGGPSGTASLIRTSMAGDTRVSGWVQARLNDALATNGRDYFAYYLGNGSGGNIGLFAGLSNPTFSTFGRYGSIYLDGASPGVPWYNSNGTTGWTMLAPITATGITAPTAPVDGQLWYNSDGSTGGGALYIRYNDGNSTAWVPASPTVASTQTLVPKVTPFAANGTWTPDANMVHGFMVVKGAGGGGSGFTADPTYAIGGGGGGEGVTATKYFRKADISSGSYVVTVGQGAYSATGGTSSVGSLVSAPGGGSVANWVGSPGGSGGVGDIVVPGAPGGSGQYITTSQSVVGIGGSGGGSGGGVGYAAGSGYGPGANGAVNSGGGGGGGASKSAGPGAIPGSFGGSGYAYVIEYVRA